MQCHDGCRRDHSGDECDSWIQVLRQHDRKNDLLSQAPHAGKTRNTTCQLLSKQVVSASSSRLPYPECDTSRQGRCHTQTEFCRIRNLAFRVDEAIDTPYGTDGSADLDLESI
jgi:hypothetical protein